MCRVYVQTRKGSRLPHPREVGDIEQAFGIAGWSILEVGLQTLGLGAIVDPRPHRDSFFALTGAREAR